MSVSLSGSIDVGFVESNKTLAQISQAISGTLDEGPYMVRDSIATAQSDVSVWPAALSGATWVVILADGVLTYENHATVPTVQGTTRANQPTVLCLGTEITALYLTNASGATVEYTILFGAAA